MKLSNVTRAVIVGATSGIGYETAVCLLEKGWRIGIAGRRTEKLKELQAMAPDRIVFRRIDVCQDNAVTELYALIEELGGMDVFIHCAGIGFQNMSLNPDVELGIVATNVDGFVRMLDAAFSYFGKKGEGHICAVSSIAGTKGLGTAPAYSASKRFQNIYMDSLEQLAYMRRLRIRFTDIRPGFVATDFLNDEKSYPMLMKPEMVARQIVSAIVHRRRTVIIDWRYRVLVSLWRLIPHCLWKRLPVKN